MQKSLALTNAELTEANHDLEARLSQSDLALKTAEEGSTALKGEVDKLTKQLADQAQDLANSEKLVTDQAAKIIELQGTVDGLQKTAKTADEIAGERIGSITAPAVEDLPDNPKPATKDEMWAEYSKIQDPTEKRQFYLAHKATMDAK